MEIRTILHSELDCHLKPDIALLKQAIKEISESDERLNVDALRAFVDKTIKTSNLIDEETKLSAKIKAASGDEKEALKKEKASVSLKIDAGLSEALNLLMEAGGKDAYHYDYDDHFNMVVAGLMGSTCYMKEDFKALQDKKISNIMTIANVVLNNGHHSTFGHSHITLEITGIPKALAMILNNEKEYATSEKSARYTVMDQISPEELVLYDKWKISSKN